VWRAENKRSCADEVEGVALASAQNVSHAAARLRMAPVSLTRWLQRRAWLQAILRDLDEPRDQADG
jgi:hypothetical protein